MELRLKGIVDRLSVEIKEFDSLSCQHDWSRRKLDFDPIAINIKIAINRTVVVIFYDLNNKASYLIIL